MSSAKPDRADAVQIAYVCGNTVQYSWHRCFMDLVNYDVANKQRVARGGFLGMHCGTDGLAAARNQAVQHFLADNKADWLWWIDTDMGFAPDTVDRLLEVADPVERPIVGGLCFFNREDGSDGMGGYQTTVVPTIYDWMNVDGKQGWAVRWGYPPGDVIRTGGTGAACILIHRSVFEKIAANPQVPGSWYDRVPNTTTGDLIGEDLSFCLRAGALDIPIHVHTGVRTTHFKPMWLSEDHYVEQIALNAMRAEHAREVEHVTEPEPAA